MAAATLDMKCVGASLVINRGASANTPAGTPTLTLTFEAVATAADVPLANAAGAVTGTDPQVGKAMVGTELTLNYDDSTGVITSLT